MKKIIYLSLLNLIFISCNNTDNQSDAYGNFEAKDILVSAQSQGEIIEFQAKEGQQVKTAQWLGRLDSSGVYLQIKQLEKQKQATAEKINNLEAQIKVKQVQGQNLKTEINRLKGLVSNGAAPQQKLDNLNQQLDVLNQGILAIKTQKNTIDAQLQVFDAQKKLLEYKLDKCNIINPIAGTILKVYSRKGELAVPGQILYKVADLSNLDLKVYVSELQLHKIKLGDTVKVQIDKNETETTSLNGRLSWISSEAEFTPKIIQTKEERVNLVYAVKISVKNNGSLKIGMPGEAKFN